MDSDLPNEYATAQFAIPRTAYAAIDTFAIEQQARFDGIPRPRIEANTKNAGGNNVRLTCRVCMVDRLAEAIATATALAARKHDAKLVTDLSIALSAAINGREHALNPRHLGVGESGYLGRG